jgi:hypothetical protein
VCTCGSSLCVVCGPICVVPHGLCESAFLRCARPPFLARVASMACLAPLGAKLFHSSTGKARVWLPYMVAGHGCRAFHGRGNQLGTPADLYLPLTRSNPSRAGPRSAGPLERARSVVDQHSGAAEVFAELRKNLRCCRRFRGVRV